ncbi:hypothetical protein [Roseovarius ramblicola]|uniref:Uncharacterized protein n=1 Tax=Roseovarius ramblicola TaxID=2022336 RepID=A0ABV5I5T9_9RHOB
MNDNEDEVTVTITLSRKAYEKAERQAKDPRGPMGEMAGFVSATEYIERIVEVALED